MQATIHGANCCGIKQIHNLGHSPKGNMVESKDYGKRGHWWDATASVFNKAVKPIYMFGKFPAQTRAERLKAICEMIAKRKSDHIVEVTIAVRPFNSIYSGDLLHGNSKDWVEVLENMGFICVSEGLNSNSSNVVCVYHLHIRNHKFGPDVRPVRSVTPEDYIKRLEKLIEDEKKKKG